MTDTQVLAPEDQQIVRAEVRAFLGDIDGHFLTDAVVDKYTEMARARFPQSSDSRIAAIASAYIATAKGWHDMAKGIRRNIDARIV